jgi:glutamine synthetase
MLGSNASIADTNTAINTAVTAVLNEFYDVLADAKDFNQTLHNLIRDTIKNHKRIFFNGNGYDDAWIKEAEKRGLSNLKSTPDALYHLLDEKNVKLYTENKVFSEKELKSRYEILLESYSKIINIEALTMIDMAKKLIIPAISKYTKVLARSVNEKTELGFNIGYEFEVGTKLSNLCAEAYKLTLELEKKREEVSKIKGAYEKAKAYEDTVLATMNSLRKTADEAEKLTAREYWPMPDYGELLFGIRE